MKLLKKIGLVLLVVFIILQAFRPDKNISDHKENDISTLYSVTPEAQQILVKACYDCHSNKTVYPWYAEIQPVAWWLNDHVVEGKEHLNFNEFANYSLAKQYHKLEECIDEVKEGEMPLESYTIIHGDAKLSDIEKNIFLTWVQAVRDTMKARYSPDSLIMKKK